jgi:hypothetical protein
MKAISIRQPWAWAILFAGKDIENRDGRWNLRGRVAIHAGKTLSRVERAAIDDVAAFIRKPGTVPSPREFAERGLLGALIGTVEILVLREPRPFPTPIPFKGALGVMTVPDGILPPD